ncbi:MAG TPA: 30S ribosomal protein S11 [Candidatus Wolfebacteria bacterium]|nr:30S ribosomal protein S11 [Candidatus Wolfebacteria bacterium]
MGKKKIIQKTEEEILKEKDKLEEAMTKAASKSRKESKKIEVGRAYINATYNNTTLTITDITGNVLAWSSAGSLGFSGPKKATPFAASKVVAAIIEKLKKSKPDNLEIIVKGVGSGRDSAVRSLANQGFNILSIKDVTPIPHNGPRPKKVRRV